MPKNNEKEAAILYFMNEYGILIDFEDESYLNYDTDAKFDSKCTFGQWKKAVFGNSSAQITVYSADSPDNRTQFKNVLSVCSADVFEELLKSYKSKVRKKNKKQLDGKLEKIELMKITVMNKAKELVEQLPAEVLQACIDEEEALQPLEPSVKEFFDNWLNGENSKTDVQSILSRLIHVYNASVKRYKMLQSN